MILAAYMVAGFAIAGVYAVGLLRGRRDRYHRLGFAYSFTTAAVCAPVQVVFGDFVARAVEKQQPQKFAAMELVARTHQGVTEWIGGIYWDGKVYFGIGIPDFDSLLVGYSPHQKVIGWDAVPASLRAPLPDLIHLSFDLMVGLGMLLLLLAAWQGWFALFRRRLLMTRWFLIPAAAAGLAAVIAMEAGWIVTEVGRQPWVVYGYLRTSDAVTPSGGVPVTLAAALALYAVLTVVVIGVPWLMGHRWRREDPGDEPALATGPPPEMADHPEPR
jgi:cytochrome d ubiquinol oxidase subunit I